MRPLSLRIALAIVRGWTRVYTWRMDRRLREARCAEIESDLWEQQNLESGGRGLPWHIVARAAGGGLDDLLWRMENADVVSRHKRRRIVVGVTSAAAIAGLWATVIGWPTAPPQPPPSPRIRLGRLTAMPPPPPPPPPPLRASMPAR